MSPARTARTRRKIHAESAESPHVCRGEILFIPAVYAEDFRVITIVLEGSGDMVSL